MKDSERNRIPELDGLRGVAIILVLSFHYINNQLVNSVSSLGSFFCKLTSFGWAGVDLFFVLSGFLIGSVLLKTKASNNFFKTFYIRRLFRIVPTYYLLLLIYIIIQRIHYFDDNYLLSGNHAIPIDSYFAMIQNFYMANAHNMGNGVLSI